MLDEDVNTVFAVARAEAPIAAVDLAETAGIHGERFEKAVAELEARGLITRGYGTGQGAGGFSFSYVALLD